MWFRWRSIMMAFRCNKSEISHWNSFEMGPKRDVLGELSEAARRVGMVNCASTHPH